MEPVVISCWMNGTVVIVWIFQKREKEKKFKNEINIEKDTEINQWLIGCVSVPVSVPVQLLCILN